MLKEIPLTTALELFKRGQTVKILRPTAQNGHLVMYDMSELFKGSVCLYDDKSKLSAEDILGAANTQEQTAINESETSESTVKNPKVKIDWAKVESLKRAGWKNKEIAEECKCSVVSIYNHYKKLRETQD